MAKYQAFSKSAIQGLIATGKKANEAARNAIGQAFIGATAHAIVYGNSAMMNEAWNLFPNFRQNFGYMLRMVNDEKLPTETLGEPEKVSIFAKSKEGISVKSKRQHARDFITGAKPDFWLNGDEKEVKQAETKLTDWLNSLWERTFQPVEKATEEQGTDAAQGAKPWVEYALPKLHRMVRDYRNNALKGDAFALSVIKELESLEARMEKAKEASATQATSNDEPKAERKQAA